MKLDVEGDAAAAGTPSERVGMDERSGRRG